MQQMSFIKQKANFIIPSGSFMQKRLLVAQSRSWNILADTHRIAISNYRIIAMSDTHVTFRYLDRAAKKTATKCIEGEQFIKLFLQHVLPFRFIKIRHYGFLSSRSKTTDLAQIRKVLNAKNPGLKLKLSAREITIKTKGIDPYVCPKCKKGMLVVVQISPSIRGSPPRGFPKDKMVALEKFSSFYD